MKRGLLGMVLLVSVAPISLPAHAAECRLHGKIGITGGDESSGPMPPPAKSRLYCSYGGAEPVVTSFAEKSDGAYECKFDILDAAIGTVTLLLTDEAGKPYGPAQVCDCVGSESECNQCLAGKDACKRADGDPRPPEPPPPCVVDGRVTIEGQAETTIDIYQGKDQEPAATGVHVQAHSGHFSATVWKRDAAEVRIEHAKKSYACGASCKGNELVCNPSF
jgi:hypothetical protein